MKNAYRPSTRNICTLAAACSAAFLSLPSTAHAGTWGAAQKVNTWNIINARWYPNNELETYTPACVWYEGSTLVIKTYQSGGVYYSGRVESAATYGYGAYSFTAMLPSGQGLLPAVWAATLNPWLPEMDAGEVVGQNPGTVYQTFHDLSNIQTQWAKSGSWSNSWHTYSFSWFPDHIDYWLDNNYTGTKWYSLGSNYKLHFIVDTAVGGDWPGNPNASTWATADGARYLKVSAITYTPYYP